MIYEYFWIFMNISYIFRVGWGYKPIYNWRSLPNPCLYHRNENAISMGIYIYITISSSNIILVMNMRNRLTERAFLEATSSWSVINITRRSICRVSTQPSNQQLLRFWNHNKLVGGLEHFIWLSIREWNVIIPTDFHSYIFQRGRAQPPTRQIYIDNNHKKSGTPKV